MHLTLFLALNIILHFFDPGLNFFGAKLGIANIVGIVILKWYGPKDMLVNNLLRVLLTSLMRGTLFNTPFFTSLSGVILSTVAVIIVNYLLDPSIVMLSVVSSIFHPIGQIFIISSLYSTSQIYILLPLLLILSILAGVATGKLTEEILRRMRRTQ